MQDIKPNSHNLYKVRTYIPEDAPYIVDTWIKQILSRANKPELVNFRRYKAQFRDLLSHNDTIVYVACVPDDENAILGWACVQVRDIPIISFVYVRKDLRRMGIGAALLQDYINQKCYYSSHPHEGLKIPESWEYRSVS